MRAKPITWEFKSGGLAHYSDHLKRAFQRKVRAELNKALCSSGHVKMYSSGPLDIHMVIYDTLGDTVAHFYKPYGAGNWKRKKQAF